MPVGNIQMSDGKEGSVMDAGPNVPEPLKHPFDGGLAYKNPEVPTTRFSHHPSAGTCREALRQPDADAAAAYNADETVSMSTPAEPPGVGFRTRHVDQHGQPRAGKGHAKRRVAAPWSFTGDKTRLAEAGMGGVRVQTMTYESGRTAKWAGPEPGNMAGGLQIVKKDPYAPAATERSRPLAAAAYKTPYRPGETAPTAAPAWTLGQS